MSKPRYRWWGYVKNVIRAYPELKRQYESVILVPDGATSADAIRALPKQDQREYEAVSAAVWVTKRYPNGDARIKMIRLMYWEKNFAYTLIGAGHEAGYQEAQAKELHRAFIMLVAEYLGFI